MKKIAFLFTIICNLALGQNQIDISYFRDETSLEKLYAIKDKIKPSLTKYDYYYHVYKLENLEKLKGNENLKNIPLTILMQINEKVTFEKEHYYTVNDSLKSGETTVLQKIIELDSAATDLNFGSLFGDFGMCGFEEIIFENNIFRTQYHCGTGASIDENFYFLQNNELHNLNNIYNHIWFEQQLEDYKTKKLGKNSYFVNRGTTTIEKNGIVYKILINISVENDAGCCPSYFMEFKTTDFLEILPNSIKIGKN